MLNISAKATGQASGEIMVYGDIVDSKWDEEDVSPVDFDEKLKELGDVKDLTVRINSYGGSTFAGNAIISMLDNKKKSGCKVTTVIEGIAASMGSVIAQAGDEIIMAENAMMMIHKPSSLAWGNADDMRKAAEMLDKAEDTLLAVYMRHFGGTEDELRAMLREETWLTASDALDCGLCTRIDAPVSIAACAGGYRFGSLRVPAALLRDGAGKIKICENQGGEKSMFSEENMAKLLELTGAGKRACVSSDGTAFSVTELAEAPPANEAIKAKAEAYDKLRDEELEAAFKNGVRAKGEAFDRERWGKLMRDFSIGEIRAQSEEWSRDAKEALHAGKHVSQYGRQTGALQNIDDYKI